MSIDLICQALDETDETGLALLVLIVLCEHANLDTLA